MFILATSFLKDKNNIFNKLKSLFLLDHFCIKTYTQWLIIITILFYYIYKSLCLLAKLTTAFKTTNIQILTKRYF